MYKEKSLPRESESGLLIKCSFVALSLDWCLPKYGAKGLHCTWQLQYNSYRNSPVPTHTAISPQISGLIGFYTHTQKNQTQQGYMWISERYEAI